MDNAPNLEASRRWHSRGYLPHFDGGEISQFVTWRLADSLPQTVLAQWRQELAQETKPNADIALRRRIEHYLDQGFGDCHLRDERLASMVQSALLHFDGKRYRLSAWVIMPNHVHILISPHSDYKLSKILHSLKSFTAHEANRLLKVSGRFWRVESFDRFIRDDHHFSITLKYIENNPVQAGLCPRSEDWRYSSAHHRWSGIT